MKYSIITVNLNNASGLKDTIESVILQTCHDYEFLIIDGGSTDESVSIINYYSCQINYWISEPDSGIFNAMNKGIVASKGDYLIFMNSGDCFFNEKVLEETLPFLGEDFLIGKIQRKDNQELMDYELTNITMMTFFKGAIPHQATFHKRTLFQNNLYDDTLMISADWAFFFNKIILENSTYSLMPVIVCRFDTTGISNTKSDLASKERLQIIARHFPPRVIKDYEKYCDKDGEMLELIPQFKYTKTLNRTILAFTKLCLYLYKTIIVKKIFG